MKRDGLKRINFKSQFLSCVHLVKAVVLNLWVMTLLEVKCSFHKGHLDHQKTHVFYVMIQNNSKINYEARAILCK